MLLWHTATEHGIYCSQKHSITCTIYAACNSSAFKQVTIPHISLSLFNGNITVYAFPDLKEKQEH